MKNRHIKNRRGTAEKLATKNEVPLEGEIIVETDTGRLKAGDGVNAYNSLKYVDEPRVLTPETWTFVLDDAAETRVDKKVALWI